MRSKFNQTSRTRRLLNLATNKYVYSAQALRDVMEVYITPQGLQETFSAFDLPNFHAVGFNSETERFQLFSQQHSPNYCVADVIAHIATPESVSGRRFASRSRDFSNISDFDFAPPSVKKAFYEHLNLSHPGQRIIFINKHKSGRWLNWEYFNVSHNRYSKLSQLADLSLALLDLPNRSYGAIARKILK